MWLLSSSPRCHSHWRLQHRPRRLRASVAARGCRSRARLKTERHVEQLFKQFPALIVAVAIAICFKMLAQNRDVVTAALATKHNDVWRCAHSLEPQEVKHDHREVLVRCRCRGCHVWLLWLVALAITVASRARLFKCLARRSQPCGTKTATTERLLQRRTNAEDVHTGAWKHNQKRLRETRRTSFAACVLLALVLAAELSLNQQS